MSRRLELIGLEGFPRVRPGDDLASLIADDEYAAGRIEVGGAGTPVVFETMMKFAPGPFEISIVAHELGADEVLPADDQVARAVRGLTGIRGADVVVDSVGEATWMQSLKCAAKGGRILTCGATSGPNPAAR